MSKPHDIFAALIYLLYKVVYRADKNVDSGTKDYLGLNPGSGTYLCQLEPVVITFSSSSFVK